MNKQEVERKIEVEAGMAMGVLMGNMAYHKDKNRFSMTDKGKKYVEALPLPPAEHQQLMMDNAKDALEEGTIITVMVAEGLGFDFNITDKGIEKLKSMDYPVNQLNVQNE